MSKEVEVTKTRTVRQTFKAQIKTSKPHFTQKVIGHRHTIEDGLDDRYESFITVYLPKIIPNQRKPCIFMHVGNGGGSVKFRCKTPQELAEHLRMVADIIVSNEWLEKYDVLEDISDHLIDSGDILLDEDFVDTKGWKGIHIVAPTKTSKVEVL